MIESVRKTKTKNPHHHHQQSALRIEKLNKEKTLVLCVDVDVDTQIQTFYAHNFSKMLAKSRNKNIYKKKKIRERLKQSDRICRIYLLNSKLTQIFTKLQLGLVCS